MKEAIEPNNFNAFKYFNFLNFNNLFSKTLILCTLTTCFAHAQNDIARSESKYYEITDVPIQDSVMLEVGGLAFTDDDKLGVATRRGEIWIIEDPYQKKSKTPKYSLFADSLYDPC